MLYGPEEINSTLVNILGNSTTPYFPFIYDEAGNLHQDFELVGSILFENGTLKIGRFTIVQPEYRGDSVSWSQTSDRGYTSGHLYFTHGGTELRGLISVGDEAENAVPTEIVATAIPPGDYTLRLTNNNPEKPEIRSLQTGFARGRGFATRMSIFIDDVERSDCCTLSLGPDGRPMLDIIEQNDRRLTLTFTIAPGQDVAISGSSSRSSGVNIETNITGKPCLRERSDTEKLPDLVFADTTLPDFSAALMEDETVVETEPLALAELLSCVTDDRELGNKTFHGIIDNMKWAMNSHIAGDDAHSRKLWLSRFFQMTPPIIDDPERLKLIAENRDWFIDTMSVAVLGNNFAQISDLPKHVVPRPLSDRQKAAFKAYLQSSVPVQSAYLNQQDKMWKYILRHMSQRLFRYAQADVVIRRHQAAGGKQKTWGERLFDHQVSETSLKRLADDLAGGIDPLNTHVARKRNVDRERAEAVDRIAEATAEIGKQPDDPASQAFLKNAKAILTLIDYRREKIEQEWREAVNGRIAHIKNVANILAILDPQGDLANSFMSTCGSILLANIAGLADIEQINGFETTLTRYLETFFTDIVSGETRPFGEVDGEEIRQELKSCIDTEFRTAAALAARMTSAISQARGGYFLERAREGEITFAATYPGLTRIYRVGLGLAYTFTIVAVASKLWSALGSDEKQDAWSFDRLVGYNSFIKFAIASYRYFTGKFAGQASAQAGPGVMSTIGTFLRGIGVAIAEAAHGLANSGNAAVRCVVGFFGKVIGGLYKAVSAVGRVIVGGLTSTYAKISEWLVESQFCKQVAAIAGKIWAAAGNALLLFSVIWSSYKEGLNLQKVWASDSPALERVLASAQFVCVAASGIASLAGIVYASAVWSGIGAIFALGSVATALVLAWKFPPDSPLQDVITRVLAPFADRISSEMRQAGERVNMPVPGV